jgi:iron(III) transport system substrate-binding protein
MNIRTSRREVLTGGAALGMAALAWPARSVFAADDPALVEAAKQEGSVTLYCSMDLPIAEKISKSFEAKYPGISVKMQVAGGERLFQRIGQEQASKLAIADVVESTDPVHAAVWKRNGWLLPGLPDDVVKMWPAGDRDPDGCFATFRLSTSPMAYNTKYLKPADAPKSFADLTDPKWDNRLTKSNPAYAGITMSATLELSKLLGWDWFRALAKNHVLQTQSATETPHKIATGERLVLVDCSEYVLLRLKAAGSPVEVIYPTEGMPTSQGNLVVMKGAPHPNAAKLLQAFLFSHETQEFMSTAGYLRSVRPDVTPAPGVTALKDIKLLHADTAELEASIDQIKTTYTSIFGV